MILIIIIYINIIFITRSLNIIEVVAHSRSSAWLGSISNASTS